MNPTAKSLIQKMGLIPHPEGGYFKEIYRSSDIVIPMGMPDNYKRVASTSIYYLLCDNQFSAWHKLKSDEIWHFYHGSPLTIYLLNKDGELATHKLGDPTTIKDAHFQVVITANQWFAAQPDDPHSYTLIGCTVAPGFEFEDFELANRDKLNAMYPAHTTLIKKFTLGKN